MLLTGKNLANDIFARYERGVAYNNHIDLYDTVSRNESFYLGDQWQGLIAPDLDKPVLNFIKRVCSYLSSMLVSDDIAVELRPFEENEQCDIQARELSNEVERILEKSRAKTKLRDLIKSAIITGDGLLYWYYGTGDDGKRGEICLEVLENTKVIFGNPYSSDVQRQPYILVVKRELLENAKKRAAEYGQRTDFIRADSGEEVGGYQSELVTVITEFYKKDGIVHFRQVCRDGVICPDTVTGYTLYPIALMNWEKVRGSYHGRSVITGLIPNQIAVNKLWAMAIRHQQTTAFPKVFYDRLKIPRWTNRVGEAVAVSGNPNDAIATSFRAGDMSSQVMELVERTINYTKEFMGASDAALGNVKPDNTSAIIAVQNATAAPLELQRMSLYQLVEDSVRIILCLLSVHGGLKRVKGEDGEVRYMDFSKINSGDMELFVEVGPSAYWSQLARMGTLDNLVAQGMLDDALVYLESVPSGYIPNKQGIIASIKKRKEEVGLESQM